MASIVVLDIETTGLDSQNDAIIEIGAVRFNGKRVEDEWSTLVNPNKPIPAMISSLTGISNEMVRNAPPIRAVIQTLADFVGDAPVLGHNVRFDLAFLQRNKILMNNPVLDTYELAAVLMPTASRYNGAKLVWLVSANIASAVSVCAAACIASCSSFGLRCRMRL